MWCSFVRCSFCAVLRLVQQQLWPSHDKSSVGLADTSWTDGSSRAISWQSGPRARSASSTLRWRSCRGTAARRTWIRSWQRRGEVMPLPSRRPGPRASAPSQGRTRRRRRRARRTRRRAPEHRRGGHACAAAPRLTWLKCVRARIGGGGGFGVRLQQLEGAWRQPPQQQLDSTRRARGRDASCDRHRPHQGGGHRGQGSQGPSRCARVASELEGLASRQISSQDADSCSC
eukprot:COSAG01_NODE_5598_length_4155_cov_11.499014_4_plen_230_part_00